MRGHRMATTVPHDEDLCHNVPYYTEQVNSGRHPAQCHSMDQGFLRDFLRNKVVERPGEYSNNKLIHSIQSAELRRQNKDPGRYEIDSVQSKRCARSVKEQHITKEADIWIGDQVGVSKPEPQPQGKVPFYSKRRAALERAQVSTYDPYVTEYMASFASSGSARRAGREQQLQLQQKREEQLGHAGGGKLAAKARQQQQLQREQLREQEEAAKKSSRKKKRVANEKKKPERNELPERSSKETQERSSKSSQKVVSEKEHHHQQQQQQHKRRSSSWNDDLDEVRRSKEQATNKVKQSKPKSSNRESSLASGEEEEECTEDCD